MLKEYRKMLDNALDTVDNTTLENIYNYLSNFNYPLLVFGNGGSAAISDHWVCDHLKCVRSDTNLKPFIRNLSTNMSLITAIANDISYDEIFAKQIEWNNDVNATVLAISSSGKSPNIVKGLMSANAKGYQTIAIVGFDGGEVVRKNLADYVIHIKANNYGVVEDSTHILMHVITQNMRKNYTEKDPSTLKL